MAEKLENIVRSSATSPDIKPVGGRVTPTRDITNTRINTPGGP